MTIDLRSGIKKADSIISGNLKATSRFAKGFAKNLRFFPPPEARGVSREDAPAKSPRREPKGENEPHPDRAEGEFSQDRVISSGAI